MVKLNEKPLNLQVRSLDIEDAVGAQKCLLPESCLSHLETNMGNIRPGDWAKCYLSDGYSSICQLFIRNFGKNVCYMDFNVICADNSIKEAIDNTTRTTNAFLEHLELLHVEPTPIKTLDLVFVLNDKFFIKHSKNNQFISYKKEYLLIVAQPILQSFKLTNNSTLICEYLEELGIAKIQVRSNDCTNNICFSCSDDTKFNVIDVKKQLTPRGLDTVKKRFDLPMFQKPYEELQFLMELAQKQINEKSRQEKRNYHVGALSAVITGASGVGKSSFIENYLQEHQCNCFLINAANILGQYPGETEAELRRIFNAAKQFSSQFKPHAPSVIVIEQLELICSDNIDSSMRRIRAQLLKLVDELHVQKTGIICLALTNNANNLHNVARRSGRFEREIHVAAPTIEERKQLIKNLNENYDFNLLPLTEYLLQEMAVHTRGYVTADLELLLRNLCLQHASDNDICFEKRVLKTLQKLEPTSLRSVDVTVQHVQETFSHIGGMQKLKQQLQMRILTGLQEASQYKRFNLSFPKGVLLYGPPGCAKTSIAKCLAAEAKMTLIATSGAEIYSPYVGCAERFLAKLFDTARKNTPCLIFLDEIDSLVGKRSINSSGGAGGGEVQLRILSTLLTEMDGILGADGGDGINSKQILVVAATNRPDMIDDALMRPGRFDKLIHVPAPDYESRLEILKLKAKQMPINKFVNIKEIAAKIQNYSGADICNLCNEAALQALKRDLDAKEIMAFDFNTVLENYKPSLTQEQIDWYINFEKGLIK